MKTTVKEQIVEAGGTVWVANLLQIKAPSVSIWIKKNRIPIARLQVLQYMRPEIFGKPERRKVKK